MRVDQRLLKADRLLKSLEFESALNEGYRVSSQGLVVVCSPNARLNARLGLVVSRRVGSAVIRNRVKRLIRESFRLQKDRLSGLDIVVIARQQSRLSDFLGVHRELNECFAKLRRKLGSSQLDATLS